MGLSSMLRPRIRSANDTANCGIEDPDLWVDKNGVVHAVKLWAPSDSSETTEYTIQGYRL